MNFVLLMALAVPCDIVESEIEVPEVSVLLQEDICPPPLEDVVEFFIGPHVDSAPLDESLICGCTPPCPDDCDCACHDEGNLLADPTLVGVALEPFYDHPAATFATYPINLKTPRYTPSRGFIGGFGGGWGGGSSGISPTPPPPVVPEPSALALFVIGVCGLYRIVKNEVLRRNRQGDVCRSQCGDL